MTRLDTSREFEILPFIRILPLTERDPLYAICSTDVATQSEATCVEIFREHLQAYLDSFERQQADTEDEVKQVQELAEVQGSTTMSDKKVQEREEDAEEGGTRHKGKDGAAEKEVSVDDTQP